MYDCQVAQWWRICLQCSKRRFDPWVGKIPWRRAWHSLQYSCLENPRDRGTWWSMVHRVSKSWIRLKQLHTCTQGSWYNKTKDISSKYYKLKKVWNEISELKFIKNFNSLKYTNQKTKISTGSFNMAMPSSPAFPLLGSTERKQVLVFLTANLGTCDWVLDCANLPVV